MAKATQPTGKRKTYGRTFGAHMSIAGGCDRAVRLAKAVGFETVQLFTKNNNQWNAPALTDEHVAMFRAAIAETGISNPVAHTSYLINLGSPDDALWEKSIDSLNVETERCERLGIPDLVLHPGSHMGLGEKKGVIRIARALNKVLARTRGLGVSIDLETTAGQGTNLGYRFEHLRDILDRVKPPERMGVCVDTCHIFAAGYSLATSEEYDETISRLSQTVGLERLRAWHLNDSCRERGSRVDRHAAIGAGRMGLEPFRHLVNDARFRHVPMILETPKGVEKGEDLDARNLKTLRGLIQTGRSSRRQT